jgi:hypothetical protein
MPNEPLTSTAAVSTNRASRYGKQLAAHLGRRTHTVWDEETGTGMISFEGDFCELTSRPDFLKLAIMLGSRVDAAAAAARLDELENVVGRHLVRFGARDELVVEWRRSDGTAGGTYRHTEDEPAHHEPSG